MHCCVPAHVRHASPLTPQARSLGESSQRLSGMQQPKRQLVALHAVNSHAPLTQRWPTSHV
ncbi:MAG: hypothetical protein DI536_09630 [Archangium gephyra]|uniref:Uncharacterized protein n=1 Tax=Archangium gephyra TaxID=48 RepID=A0A2W5TMJ4_9BACT|nr:MAG: hypothetical protein DI536_09630 [Archangium gephyra]